MKVVVCGPREWTDESLIEQRLGRLPAGTVVIHGKARGADQLAGKVAERLGLTVVEVPAEWAATEDTPSWAKRTTKGGFVYDLRAGPARNRKMLDMAPDLVIAFTDELDGGTKDCVDEALRRDLAVDVVGHEGSTYHHGVMALFA